MINLSSQPKYTPPAGTKETTTRPLKEIGGAIEDTNSLYETTVPLITHKRTLSIQLRQIGY